jgi:DUF917 family protein
LTQASILFVGYVTSCQAKVQEGYYVAEVIIKGEHNHTNGTLKLWVKNEIILSWLNDEPYIACPDLITMINTP